MGICPSDYYDDWYHPDIVIACCDLCGEYSEDWYIEDNQTLCLNCCQDMEAEA